MSKGLEALRDIENELQFHYQDIDVYNITKFPREINIIEKELKALNEMIALHDKWLGNEMSDFEFFTLLSETRYKYGLSKI